MKANSEWYRWNDPVWNLVLYQGNNSQDLITNLFRLRRAWQECYTNFFILLTSKVCGFEIRIAESPRSAHASLPKSNFRWGCCTTVQPNKLRFYIIGHEIGLTFVFTVVLDTQCERGLVEFWFKQNFRAACCHLWLGFIFTFWCSLSSTSSILE